MLDSDTEMNEYTSQWGLTFTGFYVPSFDELLSHIQDQMLTYISPDLVMTTNSTSGAVARMLAISEKRHWEHQQLTYYSTFISTASDAALDYIGGNLDLKRKVDKPSYATIKITTQGEYLMQTGEEFITDDGYEFTLLRDILTTQNNDGSWTGTGWVQCEDTGQDTNVAANTITTEVNPDDNVIAITNPEKAAGGQDYEVDDVYRERLRMENAARPGSTAAGIRSALMNLDGVREINIVENPYEDADKYGNPPNSVHIYCLGGIKEDIAETLVDYIAAEAETVGSQVMTVKDATDHPRKIAFDFATDKPIYAKITVNIDDSWNEDDGADFIKQSVADYINDLQMGDPLYITRLYPPVYDIEGIRDAEVEIGTDPKQLAEKDILQKDFEATTCDPDNIEVVVNGI